MEKDDFSMKNFQPQNNIVSGFLAEDAVLLIFKARKGNPTVHFKVGLTFCSEGKFLKFLS